MLRTIFKKVIFDRVDFGDARLVQTNFRNSIIGKAKFDETDFDGANIISSVYFGTINKDFHTEK